MRQDSNEVYSKVLESLSPIFINCPWNNLNKTLGGGLEWGRVLTICGLSGSGKSTFLLELIDSLPKDCYLINYELEMLRQDQLIRKLARLTSKSIAELRDSTEDEKLSYVELLKSTVNNRVYYVDVPPTVEQFYKQLVEFSSTMDKNIPLVVTIDHTLLLGDNLSDKDSLDLLSKTLVYLKKLFDEKGIKVLFILLSQLNRDIETVSRVSSPSQHYPKKSDIFGASSIFFCSDYVFVIHIPAKLNITWYGLPIGSYTNGLPTKYLDSNVIYLHILKNRFGESDVILRFKESFINSKIEEYDNV